MSFYKTKENLENENKAFLIFYEKLKRQEIIPYIVEYKEEEKKEKELKKKGKPQSKGIPRYFKGELVLSFS